jgi:hypothetical protein
MMRTRLYYSAVLVLAIGLAGALLIYLTAEEEPETGASYVIVEGKVYPIPYSASRTYVRDLERFGGKAAVLFDELNRWFAGLWRGKSLATTVAWISIFAALVLFGVARHSPPDSKDC